MNFLAVFKNHWKKSIVGIVAGGYGVSYLNGKWKDWKLMQAYCLEAKKYGDLILKSSNRPKRISVILNPAANKGKGKSVYEKNVAPILHLAGMEVTLITTQYEGQAKKLMGELENTDAIIIAGGDGTLSEAITGFLRRSDEAKLASSIPWCVIPLGKTNSLARHLYLPGVDNTVQFIAEMALSSVTGPTSEVDVMHIKGDGDKSVYAVSNISVGAFTDSEIRKKKNWYFGPLKDHICYIITTLRHWTTFTNCDLSYTLPCIGCNKCKPAPVKPQWSWWNIFVRPKHEIVKDYTAVQNDQCGKVFDARKCFAQLELVANKKQVTRSNEDINNLQPEEEQERSIEIQMVSGDINKIDFLKKGWERVKAKKLRSIIYDSEPEHEVDTINLEFPDMTEKQMLSIDSEQFDAMKMLSVQLLPKKLKFYCCPNTRVLGNEI